ncbi:homocysteine S-methyltransferase [Saccharothrix carnea]|uniref:Homocysteine S-methyltransferase n=1 Tax=Saccharothrix carnea TaxID=1280637 RepID=A0A2P8HD60_SACCR|nr:homocysteine S-methyltransferase family protein [Saccharothrix carnea]PSL44112.1 homocysteine S-methyltransferase [Saccharothrix carnea]
MTVLLDGGLATELHRAGLPVRRPWWTTRALLTDANRAVLRDVHERYLRSGARVITAATFRCNERALRANGLQAAGLGWMVHAAVGVAQAARRSAEAPDALVGASIAPVEDCYRPDLVPPDDDLRREHAWLATELVRARVDLVLIETMNTLREARIALEAVRSVGARAWVSFVCGDGATLLSGEDLGRAARVVEEEGAEAVLVNCTPFTRTESCLEALRANCAGAIGAYPNLEQRSGGHSDELLPTAVEPEGFAATLSRWRTDYGVAVLGGCCGSTPAHIDALRVALGDRPPSHPGAGGRQGEVLDPQGGHGGPVLPVAPLPG